MKAIQWNGNSGYCFPDPGKVKKQSCGICGMQMTVRRNILGPTCLAMAMTGHKRRHDAFFCPNYGKGWHEMINRIKMDVLQQELSRSYSSNIKKLKRAAEKEIHRLLKKFAAR